MKISTVEKNGVTPEIIETISFLVKMTPWPSKRQAMAKVANMLFDGKSRVSEDVFGWNRNTVELGKNELRTGISCINDLSNRRKPKAEEKYPEMLDDICSIMEPECHADPQLRTTLSYTNMTASSVLKALIEKGWTKEQLPGLRTISDILNRQGYRLRSVEKTKVQKKRAFTDQIFENVRSVNAEANSAPDAIRISLDTKATIKIGDFSRGGKSRGLKAVQAADHDMIITTKLTPGGILETESRKPFVFFTESNKTSDFITDGIELWWEERKEQYPAVKRLVINLDNGPECSGRRSHFLQRIVEFADKSGLKIHLAYYPPYHSKYNAIEHYWGGLEKSWNGYLLDSVETVIERARRFTWKAMQTTVAFCTSTYEKGIKLCTKEKRSLEERLNRSATLPQYDIVIKPQTV